MKPFLILSIVGFVLFSSCKDRKNQEYEATELDFKTSLQNNFVLPEDWDVALWAESPSLYNPTNMDVDEKGRIWVTEAVNYRDFNNSPKNHLNFEAGDRVVILEDTNGDGISDSSKVFIQDKDLIAPMGIAVLGNRIFVSCAPNLIVYTDENGDDVPDKKEIFLKGFGGFDHDHSLHSLVAGPDGKYYFNTGNAGPHVVADKSGWTLRSGSIYTGGTPYNDKNIPALVSDDERIWVGGLALRMKKDGTELEVLAHNFRNSYEVAVDSYGNMWQNDNDDQVVTCRVTYVMEGGNAGYFSANGKRTWQADRKPEQDVFEAHWHQNDPGVMPAGDNTGAGSPTGVVVYEGDVFGPQYQGMLLSADAGRNVIFAYKPSKEGAGFKLKRKNLITSMQESTENYKWNDVDSDKRKWFRPSDVAVGTDGAIYIADWYDPVVGGHQMMDSIGYGRIYKLTPKGKKLTTPKIDLSTTQGQVAALLNPAINVRNLGFKKLVAQGGKVVPEVKSILKSNNPLHKARAVWLLSKLDNKGVLEVENILKNEPDPRLRVVAYRALKNKKDALLKYASIAVEDPSADVRREVAISLRDISWGKCSKIVGKLVDGYDGKDAWYLEALGIAIDGKEEEAYMELVSLQPDNATEWSEAFASLVWRLHPKNSVSALKIRAMADGLSKNVRLKAVDALAFINDKRAVAAMLELEEFDKNIEVQELASWWLNFRKTNDWFALWDWNSENGVALQVPEKIANLKRIVFNQNSSKKERIAAANDMAIDLTGGRLLMDMAANNQLSNEIIKEVSKTIFTNPYLEIRTLADIYFNSTVENKYHPSRMLKLEGDINTGKNIFASKCASCHKSPEGGNDIGPDLSLIGNKFGNKAMLNAIITPNASLVFGYELVKVKLKNGQVFHGFLISEGETTVLKDALGKKIIISSNDIVIKERMKTGLMPNPTTLGLKEQDLIDLTSYLLTLIQQ